MEGKEEGKVKKHRSRNRGVKGLDPATGDAITFRRRYRRESTCLLLERLGCTLRPTRGPEQYKTYRTTVTYERMATSNNFDTL